MSSEQPRRPRDNNAGSPMGSTAAIVIAIVAVVAGFLILREIRSDDSDAATTPVETTTTTVDPALTTTSVAAETTTTLPPIVTEGATAVVANASGVDGAAGVLTTSLSGKNFTMAKATNGSLRLDISVVYYLESNPSALPVATSIAQLMGPTVTVQAMPTPPPVSDGALAPDVTVLVMLGADKATQKLDEMATATTTTVAGATAPAIDTTTSVAP
ncbi:MAG: LytR C-terminal domain-containing protein [Ilumatobacteraceae bacterium]